MKIRLREGPVRTWQGRLGRPWGFRPSASRPLVGRWGEWAALKYLRRLGWDILARNWRSSRGELDLVAYDGPLLVFVEVRTRLKPSLVRPEESVDDTKEHRLEGLASDFMHRYDLMGEPFRLDLIAVETSDFRSCELRHYHL